MKYKLESRDGKLYAICEYNDYHNPILIRRGWLLHGVAPESVDMEAGAYSMNFNEIFTVEMKVGCYKHKDIRISNDAICNFSEEIEIPKPKTKCSTRYNDGNWQIFKRGSWVNHNPKD